MCKRRSIATRSIVDSHETSEALYAMPADPQIASRFEPFALPRWRESAGLREFVVSFGRLLPLHLPSPFGDKDMIQKLMAYSGGRAGVVVSPSARKAFSRPRRTTSADSTRHRPRTAWARCHERHANAKSAWRFVSPVNRMAPSSNRRKVRSDQTALGLRGLRCL